MILNVLLDEHHMTRYGLSKISNVPLSTINDLCTGKTSIRKSRIDTIAKISKVFSMSIDSMINLDDYINDKSSFESFTSNVCHDLKSKGDYDFLINVVESKRIRYLYMAHSYKRALYLLAMIDYISRTNNIPYCSDYDDIRNTKLTEVVYPSSVRVKCSVFGTDSFKNEAFENSIPEFKRFNIVEVNVRDVNWQNN